MSNCELNPFIVECPYSENDKSIRAKPKAPGSKLCLWKKAIQKKTIKKPKNRIKTDWPAFDDKAMLIIKGSIELCKSPPIFPAVISSRSGATIEPVSDDLLTNFLQYE